VRRTQAGPRQSQAEDAFKLTVAFKVGPGNAHSHPEISLMVSRGRACGSGASCVLGVGAVSGRAGRVGVVGSRSRPTTQRLRCGAPACRDPPGTSSTCQHWRCPPGAPRRR
jgi:hypothetical protein